MLNNSLVCQCLLAPLQSNQVKRTPQNYINELIIGKLNPLVVPRMRCNGFSSKKMKYIPGNKIFMPFLCLCIALFIVGLGPIGEILVLQTTSGKGFT